MWQRSQGPAAGIETPSPSGEPVVAARSVAASRQRRSPRRRRAEAHSELSNSLSAAGLSPTDRLVSTEAGLTQGLRRAPRGASDCRPTRTKRPTGRENGPSVMSAQWRSLEATWGWPSGGRSVAGLQRPRGRGRRTGEQPREPGAAIRYRCPALSRCLWSEQWQKAPTWHPLPTGPGSRSALRSCWRTRSHWRTRSVR